MRVVSVRMRKNLEAALYKVSGSLNKESLEASVRLQIVGGLEIEAIIDTGFTGALMLPGGVG